MEGLVTAYPIDIEPEQIVRWLVAEQKGTPSLFRFDARRGFEVRNIPERAKYHLGDEEREDLSEVTTIATLEVTPVHRGDGWTLMITVEDDTGPRPSGIEATEQQIDLGTFYHQFIRRGRGVTTVTAEVDGALAEQHLKELLDAILVNRHAATAARHHAQGKA
jgi:hypothetical protein